MGLDMYLDAKIYTSDTTHPELNEEIRGKFPEMFKTDNLNYIKVAFEVGYWRKANHIHKWFVDNVQDGDDDCGSYYVSREQLEELRDLCEKALNERHNADEVLPTKGGFFFGGTDYDDYYYESLEETVDMIRKCLQLPDSWDFEYHSSW